LNEKESKTMADEIMLDETQVTPIIIDDILSQKLDTICDILIQIRDGLITTTEAVIAQDIKPKGITLGGTDNAHENAGESGGVAGQGISNGISSSIHIS
jgi:hypothetical protein